jgi:hypothetical protein
MEIPPSTKRQRSNVMGMALFAREGGLNSALWALSRSPDPKVIAQPTPPKPMPAEPMPELAIWLRGYEQRLAVRPDAQSAAGSVIPGR